MTKEQIIASLQELPDSFEPEQLIERIIALQKMEEGLEQVKRGEVVTGEETRQRLTKWLLQGFRGGLRMKFTKRPRGGARLPPLMPGLSLMRYLSR